MRTVDGRPARTDHRWVPSVGPADGADPSFGIPCFQIELQHGRIRCGSHRDREVEGGPRIRGLGGLQGITGAVGIAVRREGGVVEWVGSTGLLEGIEHTIIIIVIIHDECRRRGRGDPVHEGVGPAVPVRVGGGRCVEREGILQVTRPVTVVVEILLQRPGVVRWEAVRSTVVVRVHRHRGIERERVRSCTADTCDVDAAITESIVVGVRALGIRAPVQCTSLLTVRQPVLIAVTVIEAIQRIAEPITIGIDGH